MCVKWSSLKQEVGLVAWLLHSAGQPQGVQSSVGLLESFALAAKAGLPVTALDELEVDELELQSMGRPVGYCAQTHLFFWLNPALMPKCSACWRRYAVTPVPATARSW